MLGLGPGKLHNDLVGGAPVNDVEEGVLLVVDIVDIQNISPDTIVEVVEMWKGARACDRGSLGFRTLRIASLSQP